MRNIFKINFSGTNQPDLDDAARLAYEIYLRPGQISFTEVINEELGKEFDRLSAIKTALFFITIILVEMLALYHPIGKYALYVFVLHALFLCIKLVTQVILIWTVRKESKNRSAKEYFKAKLNSNRRGVLFRLWEFSVYINPFSIRNIWFWTLVIGIFLGTKDYINKFDPTQQFDFSKFIDIITDLLRYIIVSVIAFVATNVIRELLNVREQYIHVTKSVGMSSRKIENATDRINNALELVENVEPLIELQKKSEIIIDSTKSYYKTFTGLTQLFLKYIGHYTQALTHKLNEYDKSTDDLSNMSRIALTSTFVELLRHKIEKLGERVDGHPITKETSILTSWTNLGTITAELIEKTKDYNSNDERLEYFALQIKSPLEYINYPFVNGNDPQSENEWIKYLDSQLTNKRNNVPIYRFFVTLDHDQKMEELSKLKVKDISEKIKLKVYDIKVKKLKNNSSIKEVIKNISDEMVNKTIVKGDSDLKASYWSTAKVLDEIIHKEDCSFIRIFDSVDVENLLLETKKQNPFDYIAFRAYNASDWVFCLESLYDMNLDIANIRILYQEDDDSSEIFTWKGCKGCAFINDENICLSKCWRGKNIINRKLKLNKIFFGHEKICSLPFNENNEWFVKMVNEKRARVVKPTGELKEGFLDITNMFYYWNDEKIRKISTFVEN